jgi:hypothetical protein
MRIGFSGTMERLDKIVKIGAIIVKRKNRAMLLKFGNLEKKFPICRLRRRVRRTEIQGCAFSPRPLLIWARETAPCLARENAEYTTVSDFSSKSRSFG